MDKRGQFSIIAALLVAVVLIATVIMTYSTIRNFPTGEQPQVLSAIDETNLALKQILGFTVGYYGSILQVTGDREYANNSAYKYLMSGLEYIARMHPERAVSFNLKNMALQASWFTSQSYSKGHITVQYDLTGLGIYGINYTTSCKLSVNILGTAEDKAYVRVTADENDEPIVNLGKDNFKFYLYQYANSTWATISPSSEPAVFSDGTYVIEIPSGVDTYSYVVQVEDSRGIAVLASSFNRYTLTLTWNSTVYSSITIAENQTLIDRESFEGSWPPSGWTADGRWNKEWDRSRYGSYSADFDGPNQGSASGYLTTPRLNCYGATAIYVNFWYYDEGCDPGEFQLQYYNGTAWKTVADLANSTENQWLYYQQVITDNQYFIPNFRIRWYANLGSGEHAYVDYVNVLVTKIIIISAEDFSPITVELLQNGTMRWLGENLQLTTQAKPIPPIPVKALHVNQTINGVDREVPFQVEDWASDYRIPLGLTNNASIFSGRNMLVFLVNPQVSKVTIWWNGSDTATQTPYAYLNQYFNDQPPRGTSEIGTLRNGKLTLTIDASGDSFTVKSRIIQTGIEVTSRFMRVNNEWSIYGSNPAYAIYNGTIRDIIHAEAEWSGGVDGNDKCYNFYSHIVLTLPANATYYTYQLRLIFLNSTDKPRNITDICPIRITATMSGTISKLTENGTAISQATGAFYNMSNIWQHHWSQINSSLNTGFGIIFTDAANQMLYHFDTIAGNKTGALYVFPNENTIELLPVGNMRAPSLLTRVNNFAVALDICWYGAVVTFDDTTPIYIVEDEVPTGLWALAECPPVITVTAES